MKTHQVSSINRVLRNLTTDVVTSNGLSYSEYGPRTCTSNDWQNTCTPWYNSGNGSVNTTSAYSGSVTTLKGRSTSTIASSLLPCVTACLNRKIRVFRVAKYFIYNKLFAFHTNGSQKQHQKPTFVLHFINSRCWAALDKVSGWGSSNKGKQGVKWDSEPIQACTWLASAV